MNIRLGEAAYQRFQTIKKRLGNRSNEEILVSLVNVTDETLTARQKLVRNITVTIPEPLFCCMKKLQSGLADKG